jgi:hypothetical protein
MLFGSALAAQQAPQTLQNPPGGPSQHAIQNLGASRNPADIQRYQAALRAGALRRQGAAPNVNVNNRNPLNQIVPGQQGQLEGQQNQDQQQPFDHGGLDPTLLGGGYSSGGGGGVVTAEQARMVGTAEMIRSAGEFNRETATAEVLRERARGDAIDNRQDAIKGYFEIRSLNRQSRNEERGPQPTQEDMYRYSRSRVPERLSVAAFDRQLGTINWPAALMRPEFDLHRARVEQIFQARTFYNSGLASPSYLEAQQETDRMLATLQSLVREIDPTAYLESRKFVQGLGYEARFAVGDDRFTASS